MSFNISAYVTKAQKDLTIFLFVKLVVIFNGTLLHRRVTVSTTENTYFFPLACKNIDSVFIVLSRNTFEFKYLCEIRFTFTTDLEYGSGTKKSEV